MRQTLNRSKLVYGLLVIAATYSLTARAEADYDGQYARNIGITYQVGGNNSVVGQITNNTNRTVYVSAAFKGYAADGHMSQGGATVIFDHLDPGETARFKSGGFFEAIKSAKLTTLRTVP
ncbi:FxLYD domain-containing protein [Xanthomonas phaseoli]|uniref:FxLYD domain-containing protein n=1 Tax=Xanthomonas phaseoli TaxID=1985254 RepID=UPI00037CFC94|nr:FxLYD domain-containing protein [Xanthomonas phaseoli]